MNLLRKIFRLVLLTVLVTVSIVGINAQNNSSKTLGKQTRVKNAVKGIWGGKHIRLEITDSGANLEFDCAHAVVIRPIIPDKNGYFSIFADYTPESFGPVLRDSPVQSYRVKISAQIRNRKMTLTIKRQSTNKLLGTFMLAQNQEPFLVKCR